MATDTLQEPLVLATDGARAAALPGPAREAFAGAPVTIGGLTLRPVCLGDLDFLQSLGNSFAAMAELFLNRNAHAPDLTLNELREVVFTFCIAPTDVEIWHKQLRQTGQTAAQQFRTAAIEATARLPFDPRKTIEALMENLKQGFAPALATGQPDAKGAGPGNAPTTASAGASTSAAGSRPSATSAPSA